MHPVPQRLKAGPVCHVVDQHTALGVLVELVADLQGRGGRATLLEALQANAYTISTLTPLDQAEVAHGMLMTFMRKTLGLTFLRFPATLTACMQGI